MGEQKNYTDDEIIEKLIKYIEKSGALAFLEEVVEERETKGERKEVLERFLSEEDRKEIDDIKGAIKAIEEGASSPDADLEKRIKEEILSLLKELTGRRKLWGISGVETPKSKVAKIVILVSLYKKLQEDVSHG